MAADDIINNHSRLNRVKVQHGLKIASTTSIIKWKEAVSLKKQIKEDYLEIQDTFDREHTPKKGTVLDWIESMDVMSTVMYKRVKTFHQEFGSKETLLRFVKFKPSLIPKEPHLQIAA